MSTPQPLLFEDELHPAAVFSPCRSYRYGLWRRWTTGPSILFIGLNPSTADEVLDDPTIRRCVGFAKAYGFSSYVMGNLFAFRATDPKVMKAFATPIGTANDAWLIRLARESVVTVAAWGACGSYLGRDKEVMKLLKPVTQLFCLGRTKDGQPRHPLYMPADATLAPLRV